jgi:hypothetical protein
MPTNIFSFRQDDWLPLLEDWAAQLRGADQRSVSNQKLEALLEAIHGCYLHFPTTYDYRQVFYRVRKCDSADGWPSLVDCLNPPLGSPNYGRASMPREPILYGSLNLWTALDEIDASEGDFVQVVGFNVVPGEKMVAGHIGDLTKCKNSGSTTLGNSPIAMFVREIARLTPIGFHRGAYVDGLLSELFSAQTSKHYDYRITAMFAKSIFDSGQGLIYPSVRTRHAMNLALHRQLFDANFQILFSQVLQIRHYFGYSTYDLGSKRYSTAFSENGVIDWQQNMKPSLEVGPYDFSEAPFDLSGWRPPHIP